MNNINLKNLSQEEMKKTNGGLIPLLVAAEVYLAVCGLAAAGAGVAFVQNQLDKHKSK
jgi:lactobin A/cerein 7B family class IIb bacteriocin